MQAGTHFVFGEHDTYGVVASFTASLSAHVADWYLAAVEFDPIPGKPGLYQLREPDRDGARRTRQAVRGLRLVGYTVQADFRLDPALPYDPARPVRRNGLQERHGRLAQSAAVRTTQRATPPVTSPPATRSIPPKPAYAPTVRLRAPDGGRSR